ncbi:MAG: YceI family protein [Chitinophagaceae bacterium]|nr:YceI family protein [Chitinophagaceae bacterium]
MKYILKSVLVLFSFGILSLNAEMKSKVQSSSINFTIKNAGLKVNGKFTEIEVKANFDDLNLAKSSIVGFAKASSISTGIGLRDSHLKEKEEFFNVKKYPTLELKSVSFKEISKGKYESLFDLTIKGITKRIKIEMISKELNGVVTLESKFIINRNSWNIGGDSFTMGDMVTVNLKTQIK